MDLLKLLKIPIYILENEKFEEHDLINLAISETSSQFNENNYLKENADLKNIIIEKI